MPQQHDLRGSTCNDLDASPPVGVANGLLKCKIADAILFVRDVINAVLEY